MCCVVWCRPPWTRFVRVAEGAHQLTFPHELGDGFGQFCSRCSIPFLQEGVDGFSCGAHRKDHLLYFAVGSATDSGTSELDVGENERPQPRMIAEKLFSHFPLCAAVVTSPTQHFPICALAHLFSVSAVSECCAGKKQGVQLNLYKIRVDISTCSPFVGPDPRSWCCQPPKTIQPSYWTLRFWTS